MVNTTNIQLSTKGDTDIIDVTAEVQQRVHEAGVINGIVVVFVVGSTGAITTLEYEPGLIKDLKAVCDTLIPKNQRYEHDRAWGDGNGHSHLRASLVGPSLSVPIVDGDLTLGTWQQIIFIDFDNRPRKRDLVVQIMGEKE